jgi:hypothetical protein
MKLTLGKERDTLSIQHMDSGQFVIGNYFRSEREKIELLYDEHGILHRKGN